MIIVEEMSLDRAYADLLSQFRSSNVERSDSRLGPTRDLGTVVVDLPPESFKLLTSPGRAINPYIAIVEACWVLAGQNDLATLSFVTGAFREFCDDGNTLAGAYGKRLRSSFGFDQIENAVQQLQSQSFSRRVFFTIVEANDARSSSLDVPCNISVMFRRRFDALDMTVVNRSNDIIFGFPYDIFTFAILHSYLASRSKMSAGKHVHISNSLHLYERNIDFLDRALQHDEHEIAVNLEDASRFICDVIANYRSIANLDFDSIKSQRLRSLFSTFQVYKDGRDRDAFERSQPNDWLGRMSRNWLNRSQSSSVATLTAQARALDE